MNKNTEWGRTMVPNEQKHTFVLGTNHGKEYWGQYDISVKCMICDTIVLMYNVLYIYMMYKISYFHIIFPI